MMCVENAMYFCVVAYPYANISGRNKGQKLVGRFFENQTFW